jgi:thymidylate synthase ThyX
MNITIIDGLESLTGVGDAAVQKIIADMTGRAGLDGAWDSIDTDVRAEIVCEWRRIINDVVGHNVLSPEDMAMLQALYSRSPALVAEHLEKVRQAGSGKFMDRYYRGYGHASIGDCGSTSIFIENVSILAAKAIQDWPLYSGQEASTRYMDFSNARFCDPVASPESGAILHRWMEFYHRAQQPVLDHLRTEYPRGEDEPEDVYERALAARRFDVLRAFLPAGVHTNLSWHTNLRQAADHLAQLLHHPDSTVRSVAGAIHGDLYTRYPSSFSRSESRELGSWRDLVSNYTYASVADTLGPCFSVDVNDDVLARHRELLMLRPKHGLLPHFMDTVGSVQSDFLLDFGSFRDLQRHRNGVVRMPLLTTMRGFHPWYRKQLPWKLREEVPSLLKSQEEALRLLDVRAEQGQHYIAMGYQVACSVTQSIPAFIYRIELRTGQSVHPTLRAVARAEATEFRKFFPWIPLHADMSDDTWDIRRGHQTLIEKA